MAKADKPLIKFSDYTAVELMSLITADMSLTIEQVEAIEKGAKVVRDRTEAERLEKGRKEAQEALEALAKKLGLKVSQIAPKAKERTIAVKYRDDKGNEWAGQGATPKWIVESGKHPMEFVLPEYKDEQEKRWKKFEEEKAKEKKAA